MSPFETVRLAEWASIECEKQRSGERSVAWMIAGWAYAHIIEDHHPNHLRIQELGRLVEPRHNTGGSYRTVDVRVGHAVKPPHSEVPALMAVLIADWGEIDPDEWYYRFEEIHPFRDGNGRTGNILWNWARHTLDPGILDFPPDFWGAPRLRFEPIPEVVA